MYQLELILYHMSKTKSECTVVLSNYFKLPNLNNN